MATREDTSDKPVRLVLPADVKHDVRIMAAEKDQSMAEFCRDTIMKAVEAWRKRRAES